MSDNINLAYENESEFGSESEEEHQIGPIDGQRNSNDSRQVDDRGPVHHKVPHHPPIPPDKVARDLFAGLSVCNYMA